MAHLQEVNNVAMVTKKYTKYDVIIGRSGKLHYSQKRKEKLQIAPPFLVLYTKFKISKS